MTSLTSCDAIEVAQHAVFEVESAIAVREQYKSKLYTLVDSLRPSVSIVSTAPFPSQKSRQDGVSLTSKATTEASKKKQARDVVTNRLRTRASMPAGKELHVVGDWLLLLRAASVNVVESIVRWRHSVHQDRPLPYEIGHVNYLLQMVNDTDFLDQCDDLISWLGFRLIRNPFIVTGGLNEDLLTNSVSSCALERWKGNSKGAAYVRPPPSLVKPLVSITPEDDIVDGSHISKAHAVLREEEALYGRTKTVQLVEAFLTKSLPTSLLTVDNDADLLHIESDEIKSTVFDEIAIISKAIRRGEHQLMCLRREYLRGTDAAKLVEDQIHCTTTHRAYDLVSDHRVWQFRDKCRQLTLQTSHDALEELNKRLQSLDAVISKTQDLVSRHTRRLDQLVTERDRARQAREIQKHRLKAEEITRRTGAIRHKTLQRNREFKANRTKTKPKKIEDSMLPDASFLNKSEETGNHLVEEVTTALGAPASPFDQRVELDQIRLKNLERRQQLRQHHERVLSDEMRELNRRRDENAQMFLEERFSWRLETHRRHLIRERHRKERVKKLAVTRICSFVQTIGGVGGSNDKKFVISVYQHRAEGYSPDGLRFVAYDPSTSKNLSMLISKREYSSLGYGRTLEGINAFCQWLCVIYEKRRRQFKLIWSGAPCPPPLRVREYDNTLVCVHKEGIRTQYKCGSLPSFFIASVYIRTNDPSRLRLVICPVDSGVDIVEHAVTGSQLLPAHSLQLRSDYDGGRVYISWLHTLDVEKDRNLDVEWDKFTGGTRVFSGEMLGFDNNQPTRVHIYDTSPTEYELHIDKTSFRETELLPQQPVVLLKHEINPYHVRLPGSAFGELLTCIRLEKHHVVSQDTETTVVRASVLPSWRTHLARYVRALRMGKFGCKIDGMYHLVVVTLVQQKTEFRAHLLFELASLGEIGLRQSLRISLSQFLRCPDAIGRFSTSGVVGHRGQANCSRCVDNHKLATVAPGIDVIYALSDENSPESEQFGACNSCDSAQMHRLVVLRALLENGAPPSDSGLAALYYSTCVVCGAAAPPIAVAIPSRNTETITDEIEGYDVLLGPYFASFEEAVNDAATIRSTLEHNRICGIRIVAPTIGTHENAATTAAQLRHIFCLDERTRWPVTIVVVYKRLDIFTFGRETCEHSSSPHQMLEQAIRDTAAAILAIGSTDSTAIDGAGDDHDGIANFEGYLVSEALLVEATRVILQPELEWHLPGETVGASSWSTACGYLQNPQQLSHDLQGCRTKILHMAPHTCQILEAYTAHPKWPVSLEDVRAPFRALLSCVLHIVYVQQLLTLGGGLVPTAACHPENQPALDVGSDSIYEIEHGVKVIVVRNSIPSQAIPRTAHETIDSIE